MHGKGQYKWATGYKYDGEYKYGIKNGKGKYYLPDGRYYEGNWVNGLKNGKFKVLNHHN